MVFAACLSYCGCVPGLGFRAQCVLIEEITLVLNFGLAVEIVLVRVDGA